MGLCASCGEDRRGRGMSFASFRRFCAVAANRNSSLAPPRPRKPYALAIFREKASPEDVLLPIARRFEADLYLLSGEISDTLL